TRQSPAGPANANWLDRIKVRQKRHRGCMRHIAVVPLEHWPRQQIAESEGDLLNLARLTMSNSNLHASSCLPDLLCYGHERDSSADRTFHVPSLPAGGGPARVAADAGGDPGELSPRPRPRGAVAPSYRLSGGALPQHL